MGRVFKTKRERERLKKPKKVSTSFTLSPDLIVQIKAVRTRYGYRSASEVVEAAVRYAFEMDPDGDDDDVRHRGDSSAA